jgi:hypothetical protein
MPVKAVRPSTSAAAIVVAIILPQTAHAACERTDLRKLIVDNNCSYEVVPGNEIAVWARGKTMFDVINRNMLNYDAPGADGPVDILGSSEFSFVNEGRIDADYVGLSVRTSRYFGLVNKGSIYGIYGGISIRDSSEFDLINFGTIDGGRDAIRATGIERFYLLNAATGVIKGANTDPRWTLPAPDRS